MLRHSDSDLTPGICGRGTQAGAHSVSHDCGSEFASEGARSHLCLGGSERLMSLKRRLVH